MTLHRWGNACLRSSRPIVLDLIGDHAFHGVQVTLNGFQGFADFPELRDQGIGGFRFHGGLLSVGWRGPDPPARGGRRRGLQLRGRRGTAVQRRPAWRGPR